MSLNHVKNLHVAMLRLHRFGVGRFRRHGVAAPAMPPARAGRIQLPKLAVRQVERSPTCPRPCDTFEPKPWPYDTAMPTGLSEVHEGPGRPDNVRLLLRRDQDQNSTPPFADQDGQNLDVIA